MNEMIINEIGKTLNISVKQVQTVLNLLSDGNTVAFIARYRKEATGALDEEVIRKINEVYTYQVNLLKRKDDCIRLIDEKGMLTEELKNKILSCEKLVEVEDIYRPYKEKKKTKATEAIALGLEPLAKTILTFPTSWDFNQLCEKYITDKVKTIEEVKEKASYIISEWISDNANYRKYFRTNMQLFGIIKTKLKKNVVDENNTYEMYYDYSEKIKDIKPHRILAINRGEKEGILTVTVDFDNQKFVDYLENKIIKNKDSYVVDLVRISIIDSLKRLIIPSIIREVRSELKQDAEIVAIENFSFNVEKLLLTPPLKEKIVMGLDPAFRTGCKLAVLDKTGKVLEIAVIYPTEPKCDIEGSKKKVLELIDKYNIEVIAIGNGTASRESETFIANTIKESSKKVEYIIVSEAGASVYSASPLAIEEFPDLTVEKRSAISIGRRLQDSLSELVKIDPKSIGVGLYQHDVKEKQLDESLNFVVTKAVNSVGVNVNTASVSLLKYVSGLTKKVITEIIKTRDSKGVFKERKDLEELKAMTPKIYEQSIGFLRILNGDNPLDKTSIHPESYKATLLLLKELNIETYELGQDGIKDKLNIDIDLYSKKLNVDKYTLKDIVDSLISPERDPRDSMPKPLLKSDILHIEDLHIGEKLEGTVRNVVDFGIFIDIGLKNDGLAHISKLSNTYIKHPKDLFSVGDIVNCFVEKIDIEKKKVSLTLLDVK